MRLACLQIKQLLGVLVLTFLFKHREDRRGGGGGHYLPVYQVRRDVTDCSMDFINPMLVDVHFTAHRQLLFCCFVLFLFVFALFGSEKESK